MYKCVDCINVYEWVLWLSHVRVGVWIQVRIYFDYSSITILFPSPFHIFRLVSYVAATSFCGWSYWAFIYCHFFSVLTLFSPFFFFYSLLNPLSLFTTYTMYVGGFQQYFPRSRLLSGKSTKVSGPARPGLVKKKGLFDRRSLAICIDNQPQTTTQNVSFWLVLFFGLFLGS